MIRSASLVSSQYPISLLTQAGASLKAVQLMLGHASAQITLDRYSHLYEDDLEDLADSMDARYGAAQVRPKSESQDIVNLDEKRRKADAPTYSERLGPRSSGDRAPVS